jgi:hypothetical protein
MMNVRDPERLVEIYTNDDEGGLLYATSSYPDYLSIRVPARRASRTPPMQALASE